MQNSDRLPGIADAENTSDFGHLCIWSHLMLKPVRLRLAGRLDRPGPYFRTNIRQCGQVLYDAI